MRVNCSSTTIGPCAETRDRSEYCSDQTFPCRLRPLVRYADGGYSMLYTFHESYGRTDTLCFVCASYERDLHQVEGGGLLLMVDGMVDHKLLTHETSYLVGEIYWEGPTVHCDNCDRSIASAYGDPDMEDDDVD